MMIKLVMDRILSMNKLNKINFKTSVYNITQKMFKLMNNKLFKFNQ